MREIKFRVWNKAGEMYEWKDLKKWDIGVFERLLFTSQPTTILMQYTGLKDKNGKEIYEGDIIRLYNQDYKGKDIVLKDTETEWFYCVVTWNKEQGRYEAISLGIKTGATILYPAGFNTANVIGNIYENPELIKEGNK